MEPVGNDFTARRLKPLSTHKSRKDSFRSGRKTQGPLGYPPESRGRTRDVHKIPPGTRSNPISGRIPPARDRPVILCVVSEHGSCGEASCACASTSSSSAISSRFPRSCLRLLSKDPIAKAVSLPKPAFQGQHTSPYPRPHATRKPAIEKARGLARASCLSKKALLLFGLATEWNSSLARGGKLKRTTGYITTRDHLVCQEEKQKTW